MNEISAENMKIKLDMKKYSEELGRLQDLVQVLTVEKANLAIRLIKKGDYKIESQNSEKANENLEEIKNERDMYKEMLTQEAKKNGRNRFQQEVSSERIVQSRAFKNLIHQAKSLKKKIDVFRERNENLYKYRNDFEEVLNKECYGFMHKQEQKYEKLSNEIKNLHTRLSITEKEKNEAIQSLEVLKSANNEHKNNNH